jgi:integrase
MTERSKVWNTIGADIKTWSIGPDGISADGEEDTNNAIRFAQALPDVVQGFLRRPRAEAPPSAREQELLDIINRRHAVLLAAQSESAPPAQKLPPNPLPMSRAIEQYRQGKLTSRVQKLRTADDKQSLLTKLAAHVATAEPELGPDPQVHEIGTHHLTAFLNVVGSTNGRGGKKTLTPGAAASAAPSTMKKKLSDLSSFFGYAHSQLQATLVDPTVALDGRRKDLNTAAARKLRHYKPYSDEQLALVFEPRKYLAFNRHADYFWAPLLALHTGARLGELVTLSLHAIQQQAATGIWFLTIANEDAKNGNSQRTVPISTHLVRLGFINYVRHLRRIGANELFPHRNMNTPTAQRLPSKNCSRQFHDYLEHLGLKDSNAALVFHSFRHSVVQALQDNGTPLSDSMQLVGHLAQDHALKFGQLTAKGARSSHLTVYSHAGEVRLNVDNPLARLKGHLDRCIVLPLDYVRLRRAAYMVTRQTVRKASGKFESGWPMLSTAQTAAHLKRCGRQPKLRCLSKFCG